MSHIPKDRIYLDEHIDIADFKFDRKVATVFDDMVVRSVPFYIEIQRMVRELTADFAMPGTSVYDLGCATGTTFLSLDDAVDPSVRFIGIDNSAEMLEECQRKFGEAGLERPYELRCADLNQGIAIDNASVAIMLLTLQFIRPLYREKLAADVFRGLNSNGCLIVVEKVLAEDSLFNRLFIKYYYDMKRRNGYTDIEITQKREALENVLIPYKLLENRELLLRAGFRYVDVFFKWYNFCGIVAVK